jgi:hypothetical protein
MIPNTAPTAIKALNTGEKPFGVSSVGVGLDVLVFGVVSVGVLQVGSLVSRSSQNLPALHLGHMHLFSSLLQSCMDGQ